MMYNLYFITFICVFICINQKITKYRKRENDEKKQKTIQHTTKIESEIKNKIERVKKTTEKN